MEQRVESRAFRIVAGAVLTLALLASGYLLGVTQLTPKPEPALAETAEFLQLTEAVNSMGTSLTDLTSQIAELQLGLTDLSGQVNQLQVGLGDQVEKLQVGLGGLSTKVEQLELGFAGQAEQILRLG